jgi:hypothetical protein
MVAQHCNDPHKETPFPSSSTRRPPAYYATSRRCSIADIAELFSVDGTTIYRWLEAKDSEHPMTAVLELLERLTESVEKIAEELSLSA